MPAVTRLAGWKYKEGTTEEQKRQAKDDLLKLYVELAHLVNHAPIGMPTPSSLDLTSRLRMDPMQVARTTPS